MGVRVESLTYLPAKRRGSKCCIGAGRMLPMDQSPAAWFCSGCGMPAASPSS